MNSTIKTLLLVSVTTLGLAACQTAPTFQAQSMQTSTISVTANLPATFSAKYRGINPFTNGDATLSTAHWDLNTSVVAGLSNTLTTAGYKVQASAGRYTMSVEPASYKDFVFGIEYEQLNGNGVYRRYSPFDEGLAVFSAYKIVITDTTSGQIVDTRHGQFSNRMGLENWPEFYWKNNQQGFPAGVEEKFKTQLVNHFNTVNPLQLTNVHPDSNNTKRRGK